MKIYRVIGLMSGTSLDGIDAALIRTDGEGHIEREGFISIPYSDALREKLRACLNKPYDDNARAAEKEMTEAHAEAVAQLLKQKGIEAKDVDLVGFHGQTISHAPDRGHTCQIGDGALLSELTGIPVVNDFRAADVKAGGQGAPLAPVYHQALAATLEKPVAFLNIGGVANVTYVGKDGELIAFDTGPGNALVDDWMLKTSGAKYDDGGKTAAKGKVDEGILARLMEHAYFAKLPPKSLDRNDFASGAWESLSPEDGAATLTAFTVRGIAKALDHLPEKPKSWVVAGGGRHNKTLMDAFQKAVGAPVHTVDELGIDGDAVEAEAFAYMAVRSLKGLPISFPKTTGVPKPMTGGKLHKRRDAA